MSEDGNMKADRSRTDFAGSSTRRKRRTNAVRSVPHFAGTNGPIPTSGAAPKPPPVLVLYSDLVDAEDLAPAPVYGQYPRALIRKLLPWLRCARSEILHVCSGSLPPGEGTRVDVRPAAKPYARELYGVEYPRPSHLLREAARVIAPGGRIGIVHYITPKPVDGTRLVKAFGLSTGFDMPMRAVTLYERDHAELELGGEA